MALNDVRLSILAFPQRWTGTKLQARLLLLPVGDPRLAPVPPVGLPAFSGTSWALRAVVHAGQDALYAEDPAAPAPSRFPITATAPPSARALFDALNDHVSIRAPADTPQRLASLGKANIRKQLPDDYTEAFDFERPGPGTTVGDEFGCELRHTVPAEGNDPKPPTSLTWGEVLSFALRQPLLAQALGMIHEVTVPLAPGQLAEGGWLHFDLDPDDPVKPTDPNAVRSYAALLPPLTGPRQLFAAVLFPVGVSGDYGDALDEAADYDDGFAKIVHMTQAVTGDAATSGHHRLRPATDVGIDLGWDDEQVTVWLNRQLQGLRARLDPTETAIETPLGVGGYRVDVRIPGDPAHAEWTSLCRAFSIDATGAAAPLRFPPSPTSAVFSKTFDGELTVEPTPARSIHSTTDTAWLPQHFVRWQGGSLVVADPTLYELMDTQPRDANKTPIPPPVPTYAAPPTAVPLRYGQRYQFRCRFADLTGAGPDVNDPVRNPAPQPVTTSRFLRHVPPSALRIETDIDRRKPTEPNPDVKTVHHIEVQRPLIGYPELVFAGIDAPTALAALRADAPLAKCQGRGVGVGDRDVTGIQVALDVRLPAQDPLDAAEDGHVDGFREIYRHVVPFPAFGPADITGPGAKVTLLLRYVDQADVDALPRPGPGALELPVPRARDVRLRLTALCADKPDYFADDESRIGITTHVATRAVASAETGLFPAQSPEWNRDALHAMFLQPGAGPLHRIAAHLGLAADGLTLRGRPGERVLFAASGALRHTLDPDHASMTFAAESELLGRWIVGARLHLQRDWTWDGLADEGITVQRHLTPKGEKSVVGRIHVPFTISPTSAQDEASATAEGRNRSLLVFFDAVDPQPGESEFPAELTPQWTFTPGLIGPPTTVDPPRSISVRLPVAVAPRQTPTVVSAGIALSDYAHLDGYSRTESRRRVLWFELDEPVADPHDAVFARVVGYGPDPLLSGEISQHLKALPDTPDGPTTDFERVRAALPNPPDPPPLPVDPEPLRVIRPAQPPDTSGLDAMTLMVAATPTTADPAPRHFVVPLPEGIAPDAPELFGFWTYEVRIGHATGWSTAQARFGRPQIIKGVQHPPPELRCSAFRHRPTPHDTPRIVVTAPHATAVYGDARLTNRRSGDPRTRIWVLLYGQAVQADGTSRRNVLLARTPALTGSPAADPESRDVIGIATFDAFEVQRTLTDLALPTGTPLSVIAVELLPTAGRGQDDTADGESDPLGVELGQVNSRRILRCSPLTPVEAAC